VARIDWRSVAISNAFAIVVLLSVAGVAWWLFGTATTGEIGRSVRVSLLGLPNVRPTLVLDDLSGDPDRAAASRLERSLRTYRSIDVVRVRTVDARPGDILVSGRIEGTKLTIEVGLRLEGRAAPFQIPFVVASDAELAAAVAVAVGVALAANDNRVVGTDAAVSLRPALARIAAALADPTARDRHEMAGLRFAHGVGLSGLGYEMADRAMVERAIAELREAADLWAILGVPREWASARHHLGLALGSLSAWTGGDRSVLSEELVAFR